MSERSWLCYNEQHDACKVSICGCRCHYPDDIADDGEGEDDDPVNHPKHYTSDPSGVECITITRHRNFNIGNAIKYLWRAGLKGNIDTKPKQIEDLEKARWYIADEIKRLKGEW